MSRRATITLIATVLLIALAPLAPSGFFGPLTPPALQHINISIVDILLLIVTLTMWILLPSAISKQKKTQPVISLLITLLIVWSFIAGDIQPQSLLVTVRLILAVWFTYLFYLWLPRWGRHTTSLLIISMILIQSVWAITQFSLQSDLNLYPLGETRLQPLRPGIATVTITTSNNNKIIRAYGPYHHPNSLAGSIIIALILLSVTSERLTAHRLRKSSFFPLPRPSKPWGEVGIRGIEGVSRFGYFIKTSLACLPAGRLHIPHSSNLSSEALAKGEAFRRRGIRGETTRTREHLPAKPKCSIAPRPSSTKIYLLAPLIIALLTTLSRAALLASFILIFIHILTGQKKYCSSPAVAWSTRKIVLLITLVLLVFIPILLYRNIDNTDRAVSERVSAASYSLQLIMSHPLYQGVGPGNYKDKLKDYLNSKHIIYNDWEIAPVHNVPLLLVAELGLLPAIGVVIIFIYQIRRAMPSTWPYLLTLLPVLFLDHYFLTQTASLVLLACLAALLARSSTHPQLLPHH